MLDVLVPKIILQNIDNKTQIKEIFNNLRKEFSKNKSIDYINKELSNNKLIEMFKPVFDSFELYDFILLKHPNCNMKSIFSK